MRNLLNPHPWLANTSEPSELQENTVNDANCTIRTHIWQIMQNSRHLHTTKQESYVLLHTCLCTYLWYIFYMYAHILHYCRLVLDAYNFTIPAVFYIEIYVYFIQYQCFQDQLHSLTPITY